MSRALPPGVGFPQDRLVDRPCPACAAATLRTFYAVHGIPVRSDVRYTTADASAAATTGDTLLAQCETCAFITNVAFESTQSDAFSDITDADRQLADDWTERYGLGGKTLIEVGCGQGEFLEMLCAKAGARGIGFDPAVLREQSETANVLFVAGEFADFAADVRGGFLFCRNGLDRSADPLKFLSRLRPAAESMPVVVVTPDAQTMLNDGAFWNIDPARAGYFTLPALVRVCQRAELEVIRADVGPGGRLVVEAGAEPFGGQKRDLPTLTELRGASHFVRTATARMNEWLAFAHDAERHYRRWVVWGSGLRAVSWLATLGIADHFAAAIDTDPAAHGRYLAGTRLRIEPPSALADLRPEAVVVTSSACLTDVRHRLATMGLSPRVLVVS